MSSNLTPLAPETKIAVFTNCVDPDEVAHNELSHLDLHCLLVSVRTLNLTQFACNIFLNFADINFVVYFLALKGLKMFLPKLYHIEYLKTRGQTV